MSKKGEFKVNIPESELKKLYIEKCMSSEQIGKLYGCSGTTILNILKRYGIKRRGDGYPKGKYGYGNNHWAYKNGKYIHEGYVFVYCPNHPKSQKGYVREHVLVLEKYLGRFLEDGEVIHHRNGDRLDNRLENLLLTTQSEHMRNHKDLISGKFIKVCSSV
jgi:hypothetical protein